MGITLISLTSKPDSTLAKYATYNLDTGVTKEACPLNLAPTSSTTAQLALGDALALAILEAKGFNADDFAFSHPGGNLGRKLLLKVEDIMHKADDIPKVGTETLVSHALIEMTRKRLGMTTIVNQQGELQGIFTDGDLRRVLDSDINFKTTIISQVMTKNATQIDADSLAAQALLIMQQKGIGQLVITDSEQKPIGALNMQDLLSAGVL